ncbi:MAG: DUF3108 domain-containing protein [bacterium]|nr:MAG: DUF3108 domain-containing protein [bacterium]
MISRISFATIILFFLACFPIEGDTSPVSAFGPGERLEFVLTWAGIAAADTVMSVEEAKDLRGRTIYKLVNTAESRAVIDMIYPVRNRYESHISPEDGLPRKYIHHMREGSKRSDRIFLFDQNRQLVKRIEREDDRTSNIVYEIERQTYDTLSSLYAMRNMQFAVGDSVTFKVFDNRKNYELEVDVLAREEVEVAAGRFMTIKVQPKLKFEGIFRRKGELFVWMTDDERHIPVLMRSKVSVGSINAELVQYIDAADTSPEGMNKSE